MHLYLSLVLLHPKEEENVHKNHECEISFFFLISTMLIQKFIEEHQEG